MPDYFDSELNTIELEGEIAVGGGTNNYPDLENLPQINGVELVGNKSLDDLGIINSSIVANPYDSTSTYAVGDYVTHDNNLYKCNTAIETAEEWNAEHWTLVDVISAIPTKTSELDNDSNFASIDDTSTANNKAWSASKIGGELSGKASTGDLALKADKSDTYTKAQTDSAIVGLIDDTTTANNKAWSSSKITDEIINILPTGTASGSVASFNTSLALPLVSAKFEVNASQESGTPTPSTPKAITGVSAVNITANGDTEVINLGNTCYGGEITQDKDGHRQFTNYFSSLVNLNSFDWYKTTIGGRSCFYTDLPSGKKSPSEYIGGKCSTYTQTTSGSLPNDLTCKFYSSEQWNFSRIAIRDDSVSNMSGTEYKAYVSGSMCYEIATPTTTDLPDGIITTLSGANNISADSGNTEVVYKESINDAIAELQALFLS